MKNDMMKAILTVIGHDRVGIIAGVCNCLAKENVNVLDISQTILDEYFTMMMVVDVSACRLPFGELADTLKAYGETQGLTIRIQRTDIFDAMHTL